jgi:glycosyltransferase involved in cell wall biosynthesis
MSSVRIGMDYRPAMRERVGIGRYVAGLAEALARRGVDLRLFGVFFEGNAPEVRAAPEGARLVAWPVPSRLFDWLGRLRILPADRAVGGCDLFHHTNFILAKVHPRTPEVMTIHDLAFLRDRAAHSERARNALARIVRAAARRGRAFLVPSEATAQDCEELLGVDRARLFVAPLGVDPSFFAIPRLPRAPPYVLAVGTIEPRKNHARLVRAFDRVAARRKDLELLVAGKWGWEYDELKRAAASARASARIRFLGYVPEERLRALLAGATAMAYPSLLEGFGLPVLEAMAAGVPVLTSDREPMRSVAGDAAVLVDPTSEEAIAEGLERLLEDDGVGARGPQRARRFTWDACAEATVRAYAAALS